MARAELDGRKLDIHRALLGEIGRQGRADSHGLDLVAVAVAIDRALGGDGVMPGEHVDDGRTPAELNATNDV